MPGSYALALSEKGDLFLSLLKNKGFREESMTKVGLYAIGTSTTLESNKSPQGYRYLGGLDHGIGHLVSMTPPKRSDSASVGVETRKLPRHP